MRNMNLTPRPRDLTMLLNSDRTDTAIPEPVDTEKPNTAIPEPVDTEKPESGEGWVKTSVSLRASTDAGSRPGRRARHAHPGGIGGRSGLVPVLTHRSP